LLLLVLKNPGASDDVRISSPENYGKTTLLTFLLSKLFLHTLE